MNMKLAVYICLMLAVTAFLASCVDNGEENVIVVTTSSINNGGPVFSDVLDQGDTLFLGGAPYTPDDFLMEDVIAISFLARKYNKIMTTGPTDPYSTFLITNYNVTFTRTDGGTPTVPSFDAATAIEIPVDDVQPTGAFILICPYELKSSSPLSDVNYLNPAPCATPQCFPEEVRTIATITFTGHVVGTEREWDFTSQVTVNFGDPVVESDTGN